MSTSKTRTTVTPLASPASNSVVLRPEIIDHGERSSFDQSMMMEICDDDAYTETVNPDTANNNYQVAIVDRSDHPEQTVVNQTAYEVTLGHLNLASLMSATDAKVSM